MNPNVPPFQPLITKLLKTMKIYLKKQPRAKTGRYTSKFRGSTVTIHTA